jgi:ATP-dependent DNA helicase RecQ
MKRDDEERSTSSPGSLRRPATDRTLGHAPTPRGAGGVGEAARRLGIERLYPEQEQVIRDALAGRDVLMILPTGFGKSACYQVPSMVLPRPVVLISPLLALLQDQQEKLRKRGIPCVRIDGTVRGRSRQAAFEELAQGGSRLVMTTPETLASAELREALTKTGVSLAAVDEAHCISEWGHDFRPAYLRLGGRLRELGGPPLLALTATATEHVREAIVGSLGMREPTVVASSPHRSNLAFEVTRCEGEARAWALVRLVRRLRRPGIVYCATKREVDALYLLLRRFEIPAHRYHGGMSAGDRNTEQEHYMRPRHRSVMIATSAFGLGIDKPDIRYILHYQAPASLEQYVQEAGRGGRDGRKANCILLANVEDRAIHEALLSRSRVRPDQLYKVGKALAAWSGENRDPTLEALAVSAELGPRVTGALLAKIEEAGLVRWEDDLVRVTGPRDSIEEEVRALAGQFETLRTQDARRLDALADYAGTETCRAVYLRAYFGEEDETPCDLCDVCRRRDRRPSSFFSPIQPPRPRRKRRARGGRSRRRGQRPAAVAPVASPPAATGAEADANRRPRRRRGRRGRRRRPRGSTPSG